MVNRRATHRAPRPGIRLALGAALLLGGAHGASAALTVMPLGDSITRGTENFGFQSGLYPESAYRNDGGGPPNDLRSYREHLHDLLADDSCDADVEWVGTQRLSGRTPSVHEGHSGWRVDNFLNRTWSDRSGVYGGTMNLGGWLSTIDPDVFLVHLGTNDIGQNQSVDSTYDDLQTLLDRIYANRADATVLLANVIPISGWHGDHRYSSPYTALPIAERAADLTGLISNLVSLAQSNGRDVHLVDVNDGFYVNDNNTASCPAGTGGDPENMTLGSCIPQPGASGTSIPDGLHPIPKGERFIAERFFEKMQSELGVCGGGGGGGGGGPDTEAPIAAVDTPAGNGETFAADPVFDGSATDSGGSGFDRVRVVVRDNGTSPARWLNFSSGQFELQSGNLPDRNATLSNTTDAYTDWSVSVPLSAPGDYQLFVIAYDNAGNVRENSNGSKIWTERRFLIGASDTEAPLAFIDTPASGGQTLPPGTLPSGSATDAGGSGFAGVLIKVLDRDAGRWVDPNTGATSASSIVVGADLDDTSAASTDWSIDGSLPDGRYRLYVRAVDNAGNASTSGNSPWNRIDFLVGAGNTDTEAPAAFIDTPASGGQTLPPGTLPSGSATDAGGSGFAGVLIKVLDRDAGRWVDPNTGATSASSIVVGADLDDTSAASTDWSIDGSLPDGRYRLYVRAVDNAGNASTSGNSPWNRVDFLVGTGNTDTEAPAAFIDTPASGGQTLPPGTLPSGSATDAGGSGFAGVLIKVLDRDAGRWVDPNTGATSASSIVVGADLDDTSAASTDWSIDGSLPDGRYRLYVRAVDNAGNASTSGNSPWNRIDFLVGS